jgi:hypothetical protein
MIEHDLVYAINSCNSIPEHNRTYLFTEKSETHKQPVRTHLLKD